MANPMDSVTDYYTPSTSAEFVPCPHRFQKAFDRVWHAAFWAIMQKYNINANLFRAIEHLYDNAISAVHMNGSTEEWFRITVGARQGLCLMLWKNMMERLA